MQTIAGDIKIVSFEQYFFALEQKFHHNCEVDFYVQGLFIDPPSYEDPEMGDVSYKRYRETLESSYNLIESLENKILSKVRVHKDFRSLSKEQAIEKAAVIFLESFGYNACVIDIGKGHYLFAPLDPDSIVLMRYKQWKMAPLIYKPNQFISFLVKE